MTKDNLVNRANGSTENRSDEHSENLRKFLDANPSVRFLRLEWLDIKSINHARIIHTNMAYNMLREQRMISISSRQTHALHDDHTPPCMPGTGEIQLFPDIRSLRRAAREIYATVRCEYRQKGGQENRLCPRTLLRRIQKEAKKQSLVVLNGFEIEMVFMTAKEVEGKVHYVKPTIEVQGHQYCFTRTLHNSRIMCTVSQL